MITASISPLKTRKHRREEWDRPEIPPPYVGGYGRLLSISVENSVYEGYPA